MFKINGEADAEYNMPGKEVQKYVHEAGEE